MWLNIFNMSRLFSVCLLLCMLFSNCANNDNDKNRAMKGKKHHHAMNMTNTNYTPVLNPDLPIFKPSKRSYINYLKINDVEDIYLRYYTNIENRRNLHDFYKNRLELYGWTINEANSSGQKIVFKKQKRHATLRIFEMKQGDSLVLSFSINLLRPISDKTASSLRLMNQNYDSSAAGRRNDAIGCTL